MINEGYNIAMGTQRREFPFNTFLGNVGSFIYDEQTMADISKNLSPNDIKKFEIDSFNNIRCHITKEYRLSSAVENPPQHFGGGPGINAGRNIITHFIDLKGLAQNPVYYYTSYQQNRFIGYFPSQLFSMQRLAFGKGAQPNNYLIIPNTLDISGNPSRNIDHQMERGVFSKTSGINVFVNKFHQTSNNNNMDTELIYASRNKVYPTFIDNHTKPSVPIISSKNITTSSFELDFIEPNHINTIKYAFIFINGFFYSLALKSNNYLVNNLASATTYNVEIMLADEYFNLSDYSKEITVITN